MQILIKNFLAHPNGVFMRFNKHLVAIGCITAISGAQAVALGDSGFEFYGNLYPQENTISRTGAITSINTDPSIVSSMKKGKLASGEQPWEWNAVSSYLAVKGARNFNGTKVGVDIQRYIAMGDLIGPARNAFVSAENEKFGSVQLGQFDSVYKNYGDDLSFLGISSSNYMSTSGLLSDVTWGAASSTSVKTPGAKPTNFHTRAGNQFMYETPSFNNFKLAYSTTNKDAATGQSLNAMAIQWKKGPYYVSVQQENHNNFRALATTAVDSSDTATRLSLSYKPGAFQIAADFATLKFSQDVSSGVNGYTTNTAQVSAAYSINSSWKVAANYATNGAGSCTKKLVGAPVPCFTGGLGAHQNSVGVQYKVNKNTNVTLSSTSVYWNDNAGSNSSKTAPTGYGGTQKATVVNFQYKF